MGVKWLYKSAGSRDLDLLLDRLESLKFSLDRFYSDSDLFEAAPDPEIINQVISRVDDLMEDINLAIDSIGRR